MRVHNKRFEAWEDIKTFADLEAKEYDLPMDNPLHAPSYYRDVLMRIMFEQFTEED